MATPPTLATDWIAGSFGSVRATDDGGALEVEATAPAAVVAGEAPFPSSSPEQAASAAAVSSTRMERTRMVAPL
jgi:hypothetical protein